MSQKNSKENSDTHSNSQVISCLDGDISVFVDSSYHDLNKGMVRVCRAQRNGGAGENLMAYVCDRTLTPRHLVEAKYSKISNPHLLKLIATDVIDWPEEGRKYVYFYDGDHKTLLSNEDAPCLGWKPDDVMDKIVNPVITALTELRNKDIVHGEIWPGNMLLDGAQSSQQIILGDCLSVTHSYNLPFIYESAGRALADPIGRGPGDISDDLYAFGVSLAMILRTSDPMQGATKDEIITHKIEKGTYSTLIGKDRFNGAILELLRGLLYEDPDQRWTLDDILEWRDGRRLSPKQSKKRVKSTRPILFNDKKYSRPELLAKDIYQKPASVTHMVDNEDLAQWIDRAIEDKTIKIRIEQLMKNINGLDRHNFYNDQLTAMLGVSLYPEVPINFKGNHFHIGGFGKMFTHAYITGKEIQPFTEILKSGFIIQIIQNMKMNPTLSILRSRFDAARTLLSQSLLGSGMERCLYLLNPESHCLSSTVEQYYVRSPEEMMNVFEILCEGDPNVALFDRHTVAFLSVKDRKIIDAYFPDLRATESHRRILGQMRVLAAIQKRGNLKGFPHIAAWVASNLNQVYAQLHDALKKEKLKSAVDDLKITGDLSKIVVLFDDPKLYQTDLGNFYQAMKYYKQLEKEKLEIKKRIAKKQVGFETGNQIASLISLVFAMFIVVISIYMNFMGG